MYPGTNGSTHGERKEINPAPKAPSNETSVETGVINPLILFSVSIPVYSRTKPQFYGRTQLLLPLRSSLAAASYRLLVL